eukprot:TRINITY_DN3225_c2_g1_i2.p1 TRINITY_DN3225_c2_g1~~TRINITY_DN3225_c2_g1_i2.p1  ORF type:complete len:1396 (-),score=444.48 TRINITY_DN3225_c2_g1_i2:239-4051(-)
MVRVKISFVYELRMFSNAFGIVFPPCITEKAYKWSQSGTDLAEKSKGGDASFAVSLAIDLEMFAAVKRVYSPVHPIQYTSKTAKTGKIEMIPKKTFPDNDLVLLIELEEDLSKVFPLSFVEVASDKNPYPGSTVAMIAFKPEFDVSPPPEHDDDEDDDEGEPRDVTFVIDPGHVEKASLAEVRHTMVTALEYIRGNPQVYFNVLVVTEGQIPLFPKSVLATDEKVDKALKFIESPTFGSAYENGIPEDLVTALKQVGDLDVVSEEIRRVIFFLSPGQQEHANKLLGYVGGDQSSFQFDMFSVSLGNAANFYVLNTVSTLTNGFAEFVFKGDYNKDTYLEDVTEAVSRQLGRIVQPSLEVSVEWGSEDWTQTPSVVETFFSGDLLIFYGSLPEGTSKSFPVTVRASAPLVGDVKFTVNIDVEKQLVPNVKDLGLIHLRQVEEQLIEIGTEMEEAEESDVESFKLKAQGLAEDYGIAWDDYTCFWAYNEWDPKTNSMCLLASSSRASPVETVEEVSDDLSSSFKYTKDQLLSYRIPVDATPNAFLKDVLGPIHRMAKDLNDPPRKKRGTKRNNNNNAPATRQKKLEVKTQWGAGTEGDSSAFDEILRKINSLLNKLSKDNFMVICKKLKAFGPQLTALVALKGVVQLLFEKALQAPNYSELYAATCVQLANAYPTHEDEGVQMSFRRLLLGLCQHEFSQIHAPLVVPEGTTDEALEEMKFKRRLRMGGNVTFVGELFKKRFLGIKIVNHIIQSCLQNEEGKEVPNLIELDLIVKFLTTMGRVLDASPETKQQNDGYFATLTALSVNKGIPVRIRCLIQDLLELRQVNWKGKNEGPKTIEEIHADAAVKRDEKQKKVARLEQQLRSSDDGWQSGGRKGGRRNDRDRNDRRGGRRGGGNGSGSRRLDTSGGRPRGRNQLQGSGGHGRRGGGGGGRGGAKGGPAPAGSWREVKGSSSGKSTPFSPRGRARQGKRSGGTTPTKSPSSPWKTRRSPRSPTSSPNKPQETFSSTNAFALLGGDDDDMASSPPVPSSLSSTSAVYRPPRHALNFEEPSKDEETQSEASPKVAVTAPPLKDDEIKRKIDSILSEYYDSEEVDDVKEVLLELKDRSEPAGLSLRLVTEILFERASNDTKGRERRFSLVLYKKLTTEDAKCIDSDALLDGLKRVFAIFEDLVMDNPNAYKLLAPYLVHAVQVGGVSVSDVQACFVGELLENTLAAKIVAGFLIESGEKAQETLEALGGDFMVFFDEEDRKDEALVEKFFSRMPELKPILGKE